MSLKRFFFLSRVCPTSMSSSHNSAPGWQPCFSRRCLLLMRVFLKFFQSLLWTWSQGCSWAGSSPAEGELRCLGLGAGKGPSCSCLWVLSDRLSCLLVSSTGQGGGDIHSSNRAGAGHGGPHVRWRRHAGRIGFGEPGTPAELLA